MAVVIGLPLFALSAAASAKAAKGCHKTHTCSSGSGSGTGGVTGAAPPTMVVTASPNPVVESGASGVLAVITVETSPSLAGQVVDISSSQLAAVCGGIDFAILQPVGVDAVTTDSVSAVLDDDGNVSVEVGGTDCSPGSSVIEADLVAAPYYTALTTLVANPPNVTPEGVTGSPNPEVETGDSATSGESDVYVAFNVEADPVDAEQNVTISANELESACGGGFVWDDSGIMDIGAPYPVFGTDVTATLALDDDGNVVFGFKGSSCAAGTYTVLADLDVAPFTTWTTTFTVVAPQPTI
jgi:hypothetical protein